MHPTLIKANIALFKGERAETLRLLDEYRVENPADSADVTMLLWLEAEAQTDHDERLSRLYALMNRADPDDTYGRMARDYLQMEEFYAAQLQPRRHFNPVWLLVIGVVAVIAVGFIFAVTNSRQPETPSAEVDETLPSPARAIQPTLPPDNSRALMAETFTAQYDAGILQIKAFEDRSARVVDAESGAPLVPIPGARFYALEINFECRSSICDAPPEAELHLQLDSERLLERRADVYIEGESDLLPVALGRSTTGWIVFEVPLLNRVEALRIEPLSTEGGRAAPIVIELPPW